METSEKCIKLANALNGLAGLLRTSAIGVILWNNHPADFLTLARSLQVVIENISSEDLENTVHEDDWPDIIENNSDFI